MRRRFHRALASRIRSRGRGPEDRRTRFAGTRRTQPRRFDPAPGPADPCVESAARPAAFVAEPRSADAFDVRRSGRRVRHDVVLRPAVDAIWRGLPPRSRASRASPARPASISCEHGRHGSAAIRSPSSSRPRCCWARRLYICSIPHAPAALLLASVAGGAAQLLVQSGKFLWLSRSEVFELRSSSLLLAGRLQRLFVARLLILIAAGIVIPLAASSTWVLGAGFLFALAGEFLGRYLFFVSVVPKNIAAAFTSGERGPHEDDPEAPHRSRQPFGGIQVQPQRFDRLHVGAEDSGHVGGDHVRLLFGRLRHGDRCQGRPRRNLAGACVASGESRQALPEGPVGALHDRSRESCEVSAAAEERQAGARQLAGSADHDGGSFRQSAGEVRSANHSVC